MPDCIAWSSTGRVAARECDAVIFWLDPRLGFNVAHTDHSGKKRRPTGQRAKQGGRNTARLSTRLCQNCNVGTRRYNRGGKRDR